MDSLVALKINLLTLIRLAKTELWDSLEDLKANQENILRCKEKRTNNSEAMIKSMKNLSSIFIEIIINNNNKLLEYYEELKKFKDIKTPGESSYEYNPHLEEINELQHKLENSISLLAETIKKEKEYNTRFNNSNIKVILSQTEFYSQKILFDYEELNKAKLKYYNNRYPNLSIRK